MWASAYQRIMNDLPSHSGLYKCVKEDHGFEALKTARHCVNTASRISCIHQHIAFSQRCRRDQVLPRSVMVRPLLQTTQANILHNRQIHSSLQHECSNATRRWGTCRPTCSFRNVSCTMPWVQTGLRQLRSTRVTPKVSSKVKER